MPYRAQYRVQLLLISALGVMALAGPRRGAAQQPHIPVVVNEIAPGVYHVGSSFFYTLAIVQGDSLIVVDLPDSEARSRAMLDTLCARFPRTPVRLVVVSHHHADHVAGLGLAFAAGIPVVTHAAIRDFVLAFGARAAGHAEPARIVRTVTDSMTIGSGTNEVRVHAVSNGHADAMLIAYLPALRLLSAPDLAETGPWEIERNALVEHVRRLHLGVDRVVPGHNPVRPWSDFDPDVARDRARDLLGRAMVAMGGEPALRALRATHSGVRVARYALGGGQWPGGPAAPMFLIGAETHDFAKARSAFSGQRVTTGAAAPFRVVATRAGGYEQFFSYLVMYDTDSLSARARELALAPERVLLTAMDGSCRLDGPPSVRVAGRSTMALRCNARDAGAFRLRIDSITGWPVEVETQLPSRVYERENTVTALGGYRAVATPLGELMLPAVMETRINGRLRTSTFVASTEVLAVAPDSLFSIPDGARQGATPMRIGVQTLSAGVLYLESDSLYYALAIEQDTTVILIEAAETERRMRAMLDTVRGRFPTKRIDAVVATHHHADHLAGLPAVFDAGISVVAHADNAANVRAMWSAADQRRPSAGGSVRAVRDSLALGVGTANEVRLYACALVESSTHIVAYLPKQRLLFAADVAEGGQPTPDLMGHVRRLGLAVDSVATAHTGLRGWPRK